MKKRFKSRSTILEVRCTNRNYVNTLRLCASAVFILLIIAFSACQKKKHTESEATYTCPIHPQVVQDHPGTCPICGMDLEKKVTATDVNEKEKQELNELAKEVNGTVVGNFKTVYPRGRNANDTVRLNGYFGLDDRAKNSVSSRVSGRIEKLYIKYENQLVSKGQKLFDIYSPELLAAQRDLLFVIKNNDMELVSGLKNKLFNLGMTQAEVSQIIKTGKPLQLISIYSPYNGVSHALASASTGQKASTTGDGMGMSNAATAAKGSTSASSTIREGMYVSKGQTLFELMSHGQAWVLLSAYEKDLPLIRTGDEVLITVPSEKGHLITGKVDFIQPYYDNDKQTATIRVYIPSHHELKIGNFIQGMIVHRNISEGFFVPKTAVYDLGKTKIVWVADKADKTFTARTVTTGSSSGDWIQIKSGLNDDEKVAVNAAYLVDSDSFIETEGGEK
ncbi:hypothetical protein C3K47_14980 [Solitalea longa]|uniref:Efflux RND transporter periplasmic adaptor subunit n=1 Tax=Solitalea longa TaxID=2079460 RepID=A0A2S4ZYK9_9SPHI|nr:efflux RND transporter periplasmic adaptor subunit [Solitalea longa]POY35366.1 hypothetical protein C3K47_14980 [Solitalea longa]